MSPVRIWVEPPSFSGSPPKFGDFLFGSPPKFGDFLFLTALRQDSQAVVFEVLKVVSTALDEFHLSMEALGDAVAVGEAPHADDGLVPGGQGFRQCDDGFEAACFEGFDKFEQLRDQLLGSACGDVFRSHEVICFLHLIVNGFEGGVLVEEAAEGLLL